MRHLAIFALLGLAHTEAADDRRVPVIVELFTSEGCSSCPPADQLLSRMDRTQPVAGARVIALEEHVDYWNSLGWTDPFSSSQYRVRQNDYGRKFLNDNIFTPQMIVNGQAQFVGTDADRAAQEITRAAQAQTTLVELKTSPKAGDPDLVDLSVEVTNTAGGKAHNSNVYLAVTESDLSSNVQRGENSGRLLRHAPVVRSFGVIGKIDSKGSSAGAITSTLRLPREWKRENLRAVVFVQERDSYKITGAGMAELH
ncbi:MAG TPA: DUF1223 domain-containing protein [Bryobacteraceae bacterium]|jgi:hypothetical protein|nr:DUF1223 domain-containing protein [Bryobacteraceae bacterium]